MRADDFSFDTHDPAFPEFAFAVVTPEVAIGFEGLLILTARRCPSWTACQRLTEAITQWRADCH